MSPVSRTWRSLAEWERDPAFLARAAREFPGLAEAIANPVSRRRVLKLMAASFALAGLDGCDVGAPSGLLIPAVKSAPDIVPGLPNLYSTANVIDGFATGVVVKHVMGRPIKVDGNPLHPASLGASDVFAQAQVLDFYDPDRNATIATHRRPSDRQTFLTALEDQRQRLAQNQGAGFHILTGTITSPTLGAQLDALLSRYSQARWHQWDPVSRDNTLEGARVAFGHPVDVVPKMTHVDVLLAIDSDLLSSAPGHLRFARDLMSRRNPTRTPTMNRIYAIEPTPTLTGAMADHRFIVSPRELPRRIAELATLILQGAASLDTPDWVRNVATDLLDHKGRALIHIGPDQPPELHALVHALNEKLGAYGTTLEFIEPVAHAPMPQRATLRDLVAAMRAGQVNTLVMIDTNPVFAAPGALGFEEALRHVKFSVALSQRPDETSAATTWSVPMTHPWETWSDARCYDGTATILQPQALPLYSGMSPHQMLTLFDSPGPVDTVPDTLSIIQTTWKGRFGVDFEVAWHDALAKGIVGNTTGKVVQPALRSQAMSDLLTSSPANGFRSESTLTLLFRPDPHIWDGRYANNPWLLELPRPLTKMTWDNPLLISPALAERYGLQDGDEAHLAAGSASVVAPVRILPGQATDCIVALLGFGHRALGAIATGSGFDYYPLMGQAGAPTFKKAAGHVALASTDHHNLIFNAAGELIRHGTLAAYRKDPQFLQDRKTDDELYRWAPAGSAAWGMSIDLNTCIGCNACVAACQAENNIPVVGKDQVLLEREMHWLRIDRYWEGGPESPRSYFQPVLCMHCEQAPCEVVCPVGATVHDSEGLNVMVYNRCVGTRFCSNNCPYKVRRFNYFSYAKAERRLPQARNPDVTVRARGVMEKCTFCLQRVAEARIAADRENRPVGPVTTACQDACPTQAITFGNLRDPHAEVTRRKQSALDYALLVEQNTHPRVTYEARIHNENPAMSTAGRKT